ncbi:hypothetical protein KDH_26200 [Dictyobacter sp. S3.2.2.5]|uniref:Radical SAM core domain-containing protein n=2 Tax=Dictyobacter halimunensis TaxID=3026934 RepID=A0ABQ6FSK1_9CHLR|nr:hypothetical protein KDH_26200 [Dictyobacter sp. S3.2.2.5]
MIQTNGTLLNRAWAKVLLKHQVRVGVSMDGPEELHNTYRVDHKGQGSYENVVRGLNVLREENVPFGILSVIQLGADPLVIHHHFLSLGCKSISYILPDFTHDTILPIRERYGPTPCADFLIPIFDDWWFNGTLEVRIRDFWNVARLIMGGDSLTDSLGNNPFHFIFVETDGKIEGLDVLRVCSEGMTNTTLNVQYADFRDIAQVSALHTRAIFTGMPLPEACSSCPERDTCSGGYLPHRYSKQRGFDNSSIWCADLLRLFAHIRSRMGVSIEETQLRRQVLREKALNLI